MFAWFLTPLDSCSAVKLFGYVLKEKATIFIRNEDVDFRTSKFFALLSFGIRGGFRVFGVFHSYDSDSLFCFRYRKVPEGDYR